jgi:hypothetical protein
MTKKNTKKITAKTVSSKDLKKKAAKKLEMDHSDVDLASFKIAKKDYDKYYKLGMKYAREFNKMAIAKRKELVHNDDQAFGWTDGFVEGALVTLYDGMNTENNM